MGEVCFQRIEKAKLPSITYGQVLSASDAGVTSKQRRDRLSFSRFRTQVKAHPLLLTPMSKLLRAIVIFNRTFRQTKFEVFIRVMFAFCGWKKINCLLLQ